jgi:hypothetical protein
VLKLLKFQREEKWHSVSFVQDHLPLHSPGSALRPLCRGFQRAQLAFPLLPRGSIRGFLTLGIDAGEPFFDEGLVPEALIIDIDVGKVAPAIVNLFPSGVDGQVLPPQTTLMK